MATKEENNISQIDISQSMINIVIRPKVVKSIEGNKT